MSELIAYLSIRAMTFSDDIITTGISLKVDDSCFAHISN